MIRKLKIALDYLGRTCMYPTNTWHTNSMIITILFMIFFIHSAQFLRNTTAVPLFFSSCTHIVIYMIWYKSQLTVLFWYAISHFKYFELLHRRISFPLSKKNTENEWVYSPVHWLRCNCCLSSSSSSLSSSSFFIIFIEITMWFDFGKVICESSRCVCVYIHYKSTCINWWCDPSWKVSQASNWIRQLENGFIMPSSIYWIYIQIAKEKWHLSKMSRRERKTVVVKCAW